MKKRKIKQIETCLSNWDSSEHTSKSIVENDILESFSFTLGVNTFISLANNLIIKSSDKNLSLDSFNISDVIDNEIDLQVAIILNYYNACPSPLRQALSYLLYSTRNNLSEGSSLAELKKGLFISSKKGTPRLQVRNFSIINDIYMYCNEGDNLTEAYGRASEKYQLEVDNIEQIWKRSKKQESRFHESMTSAINKRGSNS